MSVSMIVLATGLAASLFLAVFCICRALDRLCERLDRLADAWEKDDDDDGDSWKKDTA